ncbi:MAG: SUMF1/EgtB/PvdO family nonheme iron enzyme [Actinomycetota bacterium]|jgi:iron(II)-dependent oxidoreductase|nr:SUMF1/EgtB/PvdO family nonheme iron enzyme [Actinomycetota bacterium]
MGVTPDLACALDHARRQTFELVAPLTQAQLEATPDPIMSPLDWDLGHIAAHEDLWLVHRHGGEDLLRGDLAALYDAFETPRTVRGDLPILRGRAVREYMVAVRDRALEVLECTGPGDGTLFEMVIRHEAQHNETMRQTLFLAGLPGGRSDDAGIRPASGDEWITVPAGAAAIGSDGERFSFDNERPRHAVYLPAFRIARRPVTTGDWLTFAEGGGYERREWWSDGGWAWKEEYDITRPEGWAAAGDGLAVEEGRPVMHVSWFEADAFARAHGARLPTEAEWEKAATWERETIEQTGEVWEWTASHFTGYPGFVAYPYPAYSEVFFGDRHRVLRGGSWATGERLRSPTLRNWDLPARRQIFAGLRLAKDAP